MSTPVPEANPIPPGKPTEPALDVASVEKLLGVWHRIYLKFKPLERKVETARKCVVALLVAAGVDSYVSKKFGKVSLQRRTSVNWERLARDLLLPNVIEGVLPKYTSVSEPFTRAPSAWSGEAK